MSLSCFGNSSMGELGDIKNLTLNNLKSSFPLKFEKIAADKCSIPGFAPPSLPNFAIPPIPLLDGIPPFNLFCLLPPFPGIPPLSLPMITISIPPLPFLNPIPIPIPGFALPSLPLLPIFDLGSLDFLCGLIKIDLPVFDPFADLNKLLSKLNAMIDAFNEFLNFCKENAEVISATEVPPPATNSTADKPIYSSPSQISIPTPNTPSAPSGLKVPQPKQGQALALSSLVKNNTGTEATTSDGNVVGGGAGGNAATGAQDKGLEINLEDGLKFSCDENPANLALYLANAGQIPAEPAIINEAAKAILELNTSICDITNQQLVSVFKKRRIPSPKNFTGFKSSDFTNTNSAKQVTDDLVNNKKLSTNLKQSAYDAIKNLPFPQVSNFDLALTLNAKGIPYGIPPTNLQIIKPEDVARAFYIRHTTTPFNNTKIVSVLSATGVVDTSGDNILLALEALDPLPTPLDPYTIATALRNVIVGPAAPSLKAMCIASSRGINTKTSPSIIKARENTLLESVQLLGSSSFTKYFSNSNFKDFKRIFKEFDIDFPLSLYEIIPLLAIYFEVDDRALEELFANFDIARMFDSLNELYDFLIFVAQTTSSETTAAQAIINCDQANQKDFIFPNLVNSIEVAFKKYGIFTPFNNSQNNSIANILALEIGTNYVETLKVLELQPFSTINELSFNILASGLYIDALRRYQEYKNKNQQALETNNFTTISDLAGSLKNPIVISIKSPTGIIRDILISSINVQIVSMQNFISEINYKTRDLIEAGIPTSGVAIDIVIDDILEIIRITISRIADFNSAIEAIQSINIQADYMTIVSTTSHKIPQHLINISF